MRTLIGSIEDQFKALEIRLRSLVDKTPDDRLFWKPVPNETTLIEMSIGGCAIRSAAMIEQVFLGITRRLWDDPFEWTLPEKLSTKAAIFNYFAEVSEIREKGLAFLASDADLSRRLPAPEELKPIFEVLMTALMNADQFYGQALAIYRLARQNPDFLQ